MDFFVAKFMLPFNLVAIACCIPLVQALRYRLQPSRVGSVMVSNSRECSRERFSHWSLVYSGLIAAGALALVGSFVIGYGFGGVPPLPIMEVAWVVILGGGALACFRNWRLARRRAEPGAAAVTKA